MGKRKRGREGVREEGVAAEGGGAGCSSYLHLSLELGEGAGRVDMSPGYVHDHVTMALK